MIEPYDNKYLDKREQWFGKTDGNLWKCSYDSHGPADLRNAYANMGEDNNKDDFTYELKETGGDFASAKEQLADFMLKLNGKGDESFYKWIKEVCDVELLLKTYAVNVALGMWDDLWNNGNNYYLYFNSLDKLNYKIFIIPYDYDNSLGTSNTYDPATKDPYNWGDRGILMERLMKFDEFKKIYRDELKRLVDPSNHLMDKTSATARILEWQAKIRDYVNNDTEEDMNIEDRPASWGNYSHYRLTSDNNNYFTAKANTINNMR
jgi:spore coat protein CotH